MLPLPNNCRAGKISVHPCNWKTIRASIRENWYISYRFYDDNLKKSKLIIIKGMNSYQTLKERQSATKILIDEEIDLIKRQGYNRIANTYSIVSETEVTGFTPFLDALDYAFKNIKVVDETRIDIRSCLKYFKLGVQAKGYDRLAIQEITKKHIKLALEETGKIKKQMDIPIGKTGRTKKGVWSANQFNHYRKYISLLYRQLIDIDAVEYNPVEYLNKEKTLKVIRETLTPQQRKVVNGFLYEYHYNFWRFLQIFFHSGSREIEMLRLQKTDVDLENQRFKVTIKKGKFFRQEWRTIKTIALQFWKEVYDEAGQNDHLFSVGLKPGQKRIRREQITRRWSTHIKKRFGVTADFYSLKHSNLDEIAMLASKRAADKGKEAAQHMAGHTTPVITMTYLVGADDREHDLLKDANNAF